MNLSSKTGFFDSLAKRALGTIIFLMPIFFIPVLGISSATAKFITLLVLTGIALVAYLLARMGDRTVVLPSRLALWSLSALPITFLVSALATGRFKDSVFGYGFEPTTVVAMVVFATLAFLASVYARDEKTVAATKNLIIVSFGIAAVYQVLRLSVPSDVLSFGNFFGTTGNMIGKWNDVAIVAMAFFTAAFIYIQNASGKNLYKALGIFVVAGFFLKLVAFTIAWPILAVVFLAIAILSTKKDKKITFFSKEGRTRYALAGVVLAALFVAYFVVIGQAVRLNSQGNLLRPNLYKLVNLVPNYFGGIPTEVRPGIPSSASVYASEIQANPIFGTGPNRFLEAWSLYRPAAFNQSQYWNTDFVFSVGYLPTLATTTGILGTIAILVFSIFVLVQLVCKITKGNDSNYEKTILYTTFLLLVMSVLYVPATTLLVYMFLGIGFLFSRMTSRTVEFSKGKKALLPVYVFVAAAVFVVSSAQAIIDASAARSFVQATQAIQVTKNIDAADAELKNALALRSSDIYSKAYAELLVLKAQVIASQNTNEKGEMSTEARQAAAAAYKQAEQFAEQAIAQYPQAYGNYLFAGNLYASDPEMSEKAIDMFNKSLVYKPNNPDAYFGIAKIKAAQGNGEATKEYLAKALQAKEMYTPALLASAQLAAAQNDAKGTLDFLVKAYQSDTSRSDLLLEIAGIQYSTTGDPAEAIKTLEFAVTRYPNYVEARVALSSMYAKQKRFEDAAALLAPITAQDQKTQESLQSYISSLKAGKDPFAGVAQTKSTATSTKTTATTTKKK